MKNMRNPTALEPGEVHHKGEKISTSRKIPRYPVDFSKYMICSVAD
jgi:hypothetical protein